MRITYSTLLPSESEEIERFRRPALASGYLSSYALAVRGDRDQYDIVESSELFDECDLDAVTSRLLRNNPHVLGLTVFVWNHTEVANICRRIRSASRRTKIVLGGPEVSYTPLEAFKEFDADWICTGEGEIPFVDLLNTLEDDEDHNSSLKGLVCRDDHRLNTRSVGPLIENLDDIPSPYSLGLLRIDPGGWVDLETTRGCPYNCRFCLYGKTLSSLRHFSLERVEKDVSYAIERGAADIYLMDPTFNHPPQRCLKICNILAQLNVNQDARFSVEARAELTDESMADAFLAAGVRFVEVGLQSSNRDTLKLMKRGLGTSRFMEGCRLLRERGIHVDIGIIVGLPGDNEYTIRQTADFVLDNRLGHLNIYRLQVLPGSEYQKLGKQLGIDYDLRPPYYVRSTPTLKEEHIEGLGHELWKLASQANAAYLSDINLVVDAFGVKEKGYCSRVAKSISQNSQSSKRDKETKILIDGSLSFPGTKGVRKKSSESFTRSLSPFGLKRPTEKSLNESFRAVQDQAKSITQAKVFD